MTSSKSQRGFTLLEVLVALVVLGFLMAGLTQGINFGMKAWGLQTRRIEQQADMDAISRALRTIIQQADPGEGNENPAFRGGPHTFSVVSRLPQAAATAGIRDAELGFGVDKDGRLVMRARPSPHAERLVAAMKPAETVLVESLDHIDMSYWRGVGEKRGWVTAWSDVVPPQLVKMHFEFRKGDKRHWPDLIVEPRRDRQDQ